MPTPTRRLADKLIEGGVDRFIQDRRANGDSWRSISLALRDTTGSEIDVTPETVRNWAQSLEAADATPAVTSAAPKFSVPGIAPAKGVAA